MCVLKSIYLFPSFIDHTCSWGKKNRSCCCCYGLYGVLLKFRACMCVRLCLSVCGANSIQQKRACTAAHTFIVYLSLTRARTVSYIYIQQPNRGDCLTLLVYDCYIYRCDLSLALFVCMCVYLSRECARAHTKHNTNSVICFFIFILFLFFLLSAHFGAAEPCRL